MKQIDIYQAAEKYGITEDQMKVIIYKHKESPKPVAFKQNRVGRARPLFSEPELDAYMNEMNSLNEKGEDEMDFGDIAEYFNQGATCVRFIFRNEPKAPKPLRIISRGRHIYRRSDVIAFHALIRPDGNKGQRQRREYSDGKKSSSAAIQVNHYQPFDNAMARQFIMQQVSK